MDLSLEECASSDHMATCPPPNEDNCENKKDNVENTEDSAKVEHSENSEKDENSENADNSENSENAENSENCESSDNDDSSSSGADVVPCDLEPKVKPEPKPDIALLPPDHPLLASFQRTLREYLMRMKEQVSAELDEMSYDLKQKQQLRENEGVKLYDTQDHIKRQHEIVNEKVKELNEIVEKRLSKEQETVELKKEYDETMNLAKQEKILHNKRLVELEHIQTLENTMAKWVDDIEGEVQNAKRVVSRDTQLQQQISDEKKKSDMLFYHLDLEVKKRENELATLRDELDEMNEVMEVINTSISNSNADLEALQSEQKRLTQAWTEVIIAIQHRDKILYQVNDATNKETEFIKLTNSSIEAIRKQTTKEMNQNQKLEAFKIRLLNDFTSLKRECQRQMEVFNALESKLEQLPLWLEQTEKDFQEAKREGNTLEIEIRRIQWKIDKESNKKFNFEENILKLAQEQLITDKASEYRMKLLRNAQEQRRAMEFTLAQCQNQLAETLLELERTKGLIFKLTREQEKLKESLASAEGTSDHVNTELKNMQQQIDTKLKKIDKLSHHLDELVHATQGSEISPTELKIKTLEKTLQGAEHQIREHQQFWLMLQNHYVNLSHKRQSQLNEIQVTNKQLSIIKQKSLKVDYELEKSEDTIRALEREIHQYTTKVEMLNIKMFNKRKDHVNIENSCELEHSDLINRLKENEMYVLSLESDINDLQNDIEHYKDLVLDKHRESLSWETKYKLIDETLRWRKEEKEDRNGEIGRMRAEIHRMQIRHNQLKRAQEKLTLDLKQCVMHREQIYESVTTKQFMDSRPEKLASSPSINHKILDFRTKLKHVEKEMTNLRDEHLKRTLLQLKDLRKDNKELLQKIQKEFDDCEVLKKQIDGSILRKFSNLENIVRKQNRAKAYRRLNASTLPFKISRSETTIEQMMQKQMKINESIIEVIQTLLAEYPEKTGIFSKFLQIIKD